MQSFLARSVAVALLPGSFSLSTLAEVDEQPITEITVEAKRIANDAPASSYASPATTLRYDPLTELQSRGIAEGQSDVTVRGGVFENTGFKLGAVTVMDPQTGHYVAELPVDPALMSAPAIFKGVDAAIEGFNSAVATISYSIARVAGGGAVSAGFGSDNLNFQSLQLSRVMQTSGGTDFGIALSAARSDGDGSVPFGDHEFARYNLQFQRATNGSQSDVIVSYQDKFYGWPGAYTGFASLPETDDTQTTLILVNHRNETEAGFVEFGGFHRRLVDDYDFNRTNFETGVPGSFEHETRVFGFGLQGLHSSGNIDWRYGAQFTSDELIRSTDLTNGFFTSREYLTATVVPTVTTELDSGNSLIWRLGATLDYSNRDGNKVSPLGGISLRVGKGAATTEYSLEYAATSQVPGYTALNSNPSGLFGGNPFLGRELARQLAAGIKHETSDWRARATVFVREDRDLVDWTYNTLVPFSRQANPVNLDVVGFEAFLVRNWESVDLAAGYTAIDKDANYGDAQVDASFYALNFARHRVTLAVTWRFAESFELRLDNEYRVQEDNPLRAGDDSVYLGAASLQWAPAGNGISAALVVDNITDSSYQPFPGTPASGRQYSLSAAYRW